MMLVRVFLTLVALAAAANAAPAPRGIYLWSYPWAVKNGDFDKALSVPGLDGVGVHLDWSEISPALKTYDFSLIDRQIAAARAHGLPVELSIAAGRGTPQWLFAPPPAGLGLQRLDFKIAYHPGIGACLDASMPPPWDRGYQDAFADMLTQLSNHLRTTGYDRDVAAIKLAGLNTLTEELALPNQRPDEPGHEQPCATDSPKIWASAGYRPSLVVQAMRGLAASYQRAFPDTPVVLPIITLFAFPPIGEDGRPVPRLQAIGSNNKLLDDLVHAAASTLSRHFVLQQEFLLDSEPADQRTVGLARANNVQVAWQTNVWLAKVGKGAGCAGPGKGFAEEMRNTIPCTETTFLRMLRNGMFPQGGTGPSKNGLFIEVFPSDVVAFPGAIKTAHDEWRR